jgi:hypothetical protein
MAKDSLKAVLNIMNIGVAGNEWTTAQGKPVWMMFDLVSDLHR